MKTFKRIMAVVLCAALIMGAGGSAVVSKAAVEVRSCFTTQPDPTPDDKTETGGGESTEQPPAEPSKPDSGEDKKEYTLKTECAGNCDQCPTIIVPGIGQSKTFLYDENGEIALDKDGKKITGWPLYSDTDFIVKSLIGPLLKMLVTQRDDGFSKKFGQVAKEAFWVNQMDSNGKNVYDVRTERYPYSLAECTEEERNYIYNCVPLDKYAETAGEDHLYFFAYNSFGNNKAITDELYEFIQQVKAETGHDKVNLVPISLGGTLANSLMEYYPQVKNELNRVVFVVPALDGSNIAGDLYLGKLSTSDDMLYDKLFPSLVDGYLGYLINVLIRIIPKQIILDTLDEVLAGLSDALLVNCTTLWSLVPDSYYEEAVAKHLQGDEHKVIREQVAQYHTAQVNSKKNITALRAAGVEVFDIAEYDYPMYTLVPSHADHNADGIINIESTSMGAYAAKVGETLGDNYVQKNTYCKNPAHNHISPDNVVDASAGLLPDHTFYFDEQDHESTGSNDVIMKLATELLLNKDFKDVYSMPERFPQFNIGRDTKGLIKNRLPQAEAVDRSTLSPEDAAELDAAIKDCHDMLDKTVVVKGEYEAANTRLENILVKIGVRERESDFTVAMNSFAEALCKLLSDALYKYYGPKGFSDIFKK